MTDIKARQRNELWNLRETRKAAIRDDGTPMTQAELEELDADIASLEKLLGEEG